MARTVLTQLQTFQLMKLLDTEYAKSGMNDVEFAAKAAQDLQIIGLNQNHIGNARKSLGLEANQRQGQPMVSQGLADAVFKRLKDLEDLVLEQGQELAKLHAEVGGLRKELHTWTPKQRGPA